MPCVRNEDVSSTILQDHFPPPGVEHEKPELTKQMSTYVGEI